MLPVMVLTLWFFFKPTLPRYLQYETKPLTWTTQKKLTLAVFVVTVCCWMAGKYIGELTGIKTSVDSVIAIIALIALVSLKLLDWEDVERNTNWGVLILFGGGITLSNLLLKSGTTMHIAGIISGLATHIGPILLFSLSVAVMVLLTEVSSNTASAALMVPLFYALPGEQLGISSFALAVAVSLAASCAFMLPVATPPNAIVFGSGMLTIPRMARAGLVLNLIGIILVSAIAYKLAPMFLG